MAREMKDSGVAWIGKIPADWFVEKLKFIASFCQEKYREDLGALVYVGLENISSWNGKFIETESEYDRGQSILFSENDILWGKLRPYLAKVFHCQGNGCCSGEFCVIRPRLSIDVRFLWNTLISVGFVSAVDQSTYGTKMPRANADFIKNMIIPIPPSPEQKGIGAFLDQKCKEIDAVLAKTRASIEEYKKLKQAIITQAVTKGVRGDRPMKESGIEWVGAIPADWSINLAFQLFLQVKNKNDGMKERNLLSLSYGRIKRRNIDASEGLLPESFEGYNIIEKDDIVLRLTDLQNDQTSLRVGLSTERGIITSAYLTIRNHSKNLANFLYYFLHAFDVSKGFYGMGGGVRQGINWDGVKNLKIAVPSVDEQKEICEYLYAKCDAIDYLITQKQLLIDTIETYRKSLIYEYVTGKKDTSSGGIYQVQEHTAYLYFPATLQTKKPRFAQAVLMSKVLDECKTKMGRVKLEKIMFVLENSIGFDFETEYVREAAGPLDKSIYACEKIISKKNKWFAIKKSKYGVSYRPTKVVAEYKKYYNKYFADYENSINHVIDIFREFNADKAEIYATLYGAWNDFIIDNKTFTDDDIVGEVLNNWNDTKKRFPKEKWLCAIQEMRSFDLTPHGYGRHTIVKEGQNLGHHRKTL